MTTTQQTIRMLRRGDTAGRHLCHLRCETPRPDCRCLAARLAEPDHPDAPRRDLDGDLTGIAPASATPPPATRQTAAARLWRAVLRAIAGRG